MRSTDCTCGWVDRGPALHEVWIMSRWADDCPRHGAGTEWRKRVQDHAAKLGGSVRTPPPESNRT